MIDGFYLKQQRAKQTLAIHSNPFRSSNIFYAYLWSHTHIYNGLNDEKIKSLK